MRRSHSEFIEKLKSINPSVEVIGEYTKAQERNYLVRLKIFMVVVYLILFLIMHLHY